MELYVMYLLKFSALIVTFYIVFAVIMLLKKKSIDKLSIYMGVLLIIVWGATGLAFVLEIAWAYPGDAWMVVGLVIIFGDAFWMKFRVDRIREGKQVDLPESVNNIIRTVCADKVGSMAETLWIGIPVAIASAALSVSVEVFLFALAGLGLAWVLIRTENRIKQLDSPIIISDR